MTQKGISNTLLLAIVLAIVALGVLFMVKSTTKVDNGPQPLEATEATEATFESMGNDEGAPEEVNDEAVEEMDQIFVELEGSAPSEDFSDIKY